MKRYGKGGIIMSAVNTNYEYKPAYSVSATDKADKSKETSTVRLSTDVQKYLEQLKGKYKNVDFIVADFSSDEEAQKHLATGKGEYNCVITPDTLEKMAADETERAKFEGIIDKAIGELPEIRKQLGDDSENVTKLGISVDSEGNVSYYALIKESLKKNENVEKAKEKAAEKKAEEAKKEEKEEYEERLVTASSVEELIKLIKAAYSEKSDDRFEKSDKNDDALKIDRVDFSGGKAQPAYEQYVPSAVPEEKHPFDFKA
ncbi:MAG: DUF6033 family protein [[Eubacterium] siraeum]